MLDPLTVIGMHRSGTSLVARLLSACNIWMGYDLDVNHESLFFRNINNSILSKHSESWHKFARTLNELENPNILVDWSEEVINILKKDISNKHFRIDKQTNSVSDSSSIVIEKILWGWKDPRTTLLIPLWKQIYPNLYMIAIVRHPVDVCVSLYSRELQRYEGKIQMGRKDLVFEFPLKRCFELWKAYNFCVLKALEQYPNHTKLFRYEQLKDRNILKSLFSFINQSCDIDKLISMISYPSLNRYTNPPEYDQLIERIKNDHLVNELGYNK